MKRQRFLKVGGSLRRVSGGPPRTMWSVYSDRGLAWLLARFV